MTDARAFEASTSPAQAAMMLDTFASVGATHFDVTFTDLDSQKAGFRVNRPLAELQKTMPAEIAARTRDRHNVIVRPRVDGAVVVQLDDLDRQKAARIAPAAFLVLETSPANYQAWVAVKDAPVGLTARLRRGIGADLNASGATRVAGTLNFKRKYEPDFPAVRIAARTKGRYATVDELAGLEVLAPDTKILDAPEFTTGSMPGKKPARSWPSYGRCIDDAPAGPSGHPSRTKVDFTWCMIALSWGHSVEMTAARLMDVSSKAQENGEGYATKTAKSAAFAAAQRNARKLQP